MELVIALEVSLVVVVHNMAVQLPMTLASIGAQRGVDLARCEVIVVDNGSDSAVPDTVLAGLPGPPGFCGLTTPMCRRPLRQTGA